MLHLFVLEREMARHTDQGSYGGVAPVLSGRLGRPGVEGLAVARTGRPREVRLSLPGSMATASSEVWTVTMARCGFALRAVFFPASMVAPVGD